MGGFGRHQWKIAIIQSLCMAMGSYAVYPMGFYELQPSYLCSSDEVNWYSCTNDVFCPNLRKDSIPTPYYKVDLASESSLKNWVGQFDLDCSPKTDFGLFGSSFFAGVVLGSLILPRLSDIYGRRRIALIGNILHVFSGVILLFSTKFSFALFLIFLMGLAMGARVFVGYVFMSENMRNEDVSKVTIYMFVLDSLSIFVSALYFRAISKDWRYVFGIPLLVVCCSTFFMYL